MGNPAVTSMSRVESQAVRHLGRTRKEGNGTNRTTLDLPDSVVVSQRGAVTLVRLSQPAKRNAIDLERFMAKRVGASRARSADGGLIVAAGV